MPDIPQEAVREAVEAYTCAWVAGVWRHEELVSVVLEAAAPGIAAHARAQAVQGLDISRGSDLVADAVDAWHDAPVNEHGGIPLDEQMAFILAAVVPTVAAQARADERRKVAREIAKEISRQKPAGGTQLTWDGGLRRAARVARQIGEAHVEEA